jgi:hypothetical protein
MQERGWHSKETLQNALEELRHYGFLTLTRQGGRNLCSLFAVTWWAIDDCGGKLDVGETRVPSNEWRHDCEDWGRRARKNPCPDFPPQLTRLSGQLNR